MSSTATRTLVLGFALATAFACDAPRRSGFAATLVVTDRLDRFMNERSHSSAVRPVSAARGDIVWGLITFSHCVADAHGRCRVVADFTVLRPDGSTYATHDGADVWSATPPWGREPQLSSARLGLHLKPGDPLGRYRIRAVVTDLEAKRSLTLESAFDVGERTTAR